MTSAPVVTLTNGIRVANFSSPHPFTFDDGTVLPACDPERSRSLTLEAVERPTPRGSWTDIELWFRPTRIVDTALAELESDPDITIILVPLPVMEAMKDCGRNIGKCRVCRVADRITKTICANRFCI